MKRTITIDPVTRISGFLEINLQLEENIIRNASTSGLLYRGFEKMLQGRSPLDAIYFTERICGICSTAHAMASTLALEDAFKIFPDKNDRYLRDLIHGFEFIQNHIRQFYLFVVPGFVGFNDVKPISPQMGEDFRIPDYLSRRIRENYIKSIEISRQAHEGLAVLGGKAPHNHGIFIGGVTVNIDSYKLTKIKSIISNTKEFIENSMIEDVNIISKYYQDYFEKGKSYPNFMSFGVFDSYDDKDISYVKPGISIEGKTYTFDSSKITENIKYSWYVRENETVTSGSDYNEETNIEKSGAYSFVKAPRYNGYPMEVGPIARMILSGGYKGSNSAMDRNIARVLEAKKIIGIMDEITKRVELRKSNIGIYDIPKEAFGVGLIDTTRGSLGHWIHIKDKTINHYDIITPTAWNLSPMDARGIHGPSERALIGTRVGNVDIPIEPGRIVRSFDPCISCATHVITDKNKSYTINIL